MNDLLTLTTASEDDEVARAALADLYEQEGWELAASGARWCVKKGLWPCCFERGVWGNYAWYDDRMRPSSPHDLPVRLFVRLKAGYGGDNPSLIGRYYRKLEDAMNDLGGALCEVLPV